MAPEKFDELNDNDINQITNYYYSKYKLKKRRKSSLKQELRKVDTEKLEVSGSIQIPRVITGTPGTTP